MAKDLTRVKKRIQDTIPSKNNAIYNSNMYWSQKPYNIADILIEELSEEGEVVFDPFLGSGVTLLEAIKKKYNRIGIGCEINEAPLHIIRTLLGDYNLEDYREKSRELISKIRKLEKYYEVECPVCGSIGHTRTVLFNLSDRMATPELLKVNMVCPICKKVEKQPDTRDLASLNTEHELKILKKTTLVENSKLAVYEGETIDQIFTKRNFKVLDEIILCFKEYPEYESIFNYILMSVLHLCKITDTHSNSQWPLWIPKKDCVEKNVVEILCKKIEKFEDTIRELVDEYDTNKQYKLLHKGSQFINEQDIPDNSVDLIITDPPYLGQVAYSEYMQLYKPFLGLDFDMKDEIIVTSTPSRKISEDEYFGLLNKVFEICDQKMKCGGFFCMYFHDCNLDVWDRLITIMSNNHFQYISQEHIKKSNTLKNIISPKKSLSGDAIVFFEKTRFEFDEYEPSEPIDEIEKNIIKQITRTLEVKGPQSTPELYDGGIIEYIVYNGWLNAISQKYKTLVELCEKYYDWDPKVNKWKQKKRKIG